MENWYYYATKGMRPTVTKYTDLRHLGIGWFDVIFRKHIQFSGRASRKEYWMFVCTQIAIMLVLVVVSGFISYFLSRTLAQTTVKIATQTASENIDKTIDPAVKAVGTKIVFSYINVFLHILTRHVLLFIFFLVTFLPSFALQSRRLHDRGLSGWLCLIFFVPFIGWTFGWIILFVLSSLDSQQGDNGYGPYPKDAGNVKY